MLEGTIGGVNSVDGFSWFHVLVGFYLWGKILISIQNFKPEQKSKGSTAILLLYLALQEIPHKSFSIWYKFFFCCCFFLKSFLFPNP